MAQSRDVHTALTLYVELQVTDTILNDPTLARMLEHISERIARIVAREPFVKEVVVDRDTLGWEESAHE